MMIKHLLILSLSAMMTSVVHAGSYTYKQYGGSDTSEVVFSDKNVEALTSSKPSQGSVKIEEERTGSWMTSLGTFDDQFHDDLEKLIRSKNSNRLMLVFRIHQVKKSNTRALSLHQVLSLHRVVQRDRVIASIETPTISLSRALLTGMAFQEVW